MKDSLIGRTIGKYQIKEYLGRGGMAIVYKAYQATLDRFVALKLMHSFLVEDEGFLARFRSEARAIANLRHPNIVQAYDFDVTDGVYYYMVMEFVDGYTLKDKLAELTRKDEIMPLDETIRLVRDVASALSYAHSHDMVHRDIKPSNVMVNKENQVILTDFGIAKIMSNPQYTTTGSITGTPSYMSPEQGLGKGGDGRSDIYSLGTMLFQMVTGQLPYDADTAIAVVLQHINDPLPLPSTINPALPLGIDRIIVKAMAKNPDDRHQTAGELLEDLDYLQSELSISGTAPSSHPVFAATGPVRPTSAVFTDPLLPSPTPPAILMGAVQLPPYNLSPGNVANEPADLPAVCDADWDRAVDQFSRGYITDWLRADVERLRAAHQHGLADELEPIAAHGEAIVRRIGQKNVVTLCAGLEEFLELLGATPPVLDITPPKLVLPAVGAGESGKPVSLTITNKGRGYLFGRAVCLVPWLQTTAEWFGCLPGEHHTVTVHPDLSRLPTGRIHSEGGIQIRTIGGEQTLPVEVDILPATLRVDTSGLDFGSMGQGEAAEATFTLTNSGQGYLMGRVLCRVPWLTTLPEQFRVPVGKSTQFTVTLDSETLSPGDVTHSWALVIESNGGHTVLGVRAEVLAPRLELEPTQINLGTLDLAQPQVGTRAELTVRNTGHGVLTGAVTTEGDWLSIEPAAFRCRAGETQQVRLSPAGLKAGSYRQAVPVVSNAGETEVLVTLQVRFSLEPALVQIPAGEFLRGSPETDKAAHISEKPQHQIFLEEYWIGKNPVTNAQYAAFVQATRRRSPEHWVEGRPPQGLENHPVVNVSWYDAAAFCRWLAEVTGKPYRLPSEAEWEKAARGLEGQVYPWGSRWRRRRCNSLEEKNRGTTPVGAYSPKGDSPYGCTDMAGNVWEWVADWYASDYYTRSSVSSNPFGPASGASKALRGGSWRANAGKARSTNRYTGNPKLTSPEVGFRCVAA